MEKREIKNHQDYLHLVDEILKHDQLYYQECKPLISDYEYDQLAKLLEGYEQAHPDEIVANSPTKRVGEAITTGFKHGSHTFPMLSLANTYSKEEVEDFIKRVQKWLERKTVSFCVELKMDGTAISLRYEKGILTRALTRGNGKIGDDVTANVKTISSLPIVLSGEKIPEVLEVRGEVFMHKKTFQELNRQKEEGGEELWANPRNAAAGSLKLLDPKEVVQRHLDIVCYAIVEGADHLSSQWEMHRFLRELKIPVSDEKYFTKCADIDEIFAFADRIQAERSKLSFEIDGIVIKVDDLSFQAKLGATGKTPRHSVAYKFAPEQAYTQIEEITVQVGRTGVLTPVAELRPVHLAGSTIARATLHNQDEVKRKDIREKDWVIIEKGGDVIPKVVEVDLSKRSHESKIWHMPKECPICHTSVLHKEGEVAIRCPNPKCSARKQRKIFFFASKVAMDIEHMGEKVIEQLLDKGLISRVSDIYLLTEEQLKHLEGYKEKSIQNLLTSIENSKKCTLTRFLIALEIPYVGAETSDMLAQEAGSLEKLMTMKMEELEEIEGIGDKVAKSIVDFFADFSNREEIHLLLSHGVKPENPKRRIDVLHPFYKKTFVLTGTLKNFTRQEATNLIKDRGGKTSGSVSKETDYVLFGDDPGSKYDKAKKIGVSLLTEEEFQKLL